MIAIWTLFPLSLLFESYSRNNDQANAIKFHSFWVYIWIHNPFKIYFWRTKNLFHSLACGYIVFGTSYWKDNLFYIMANLVAFLMFFLKTGCYNLWVSFWVAELWFFPKSVYLFWVIAALHFVLSRIKFILLAQDILFSLGSSGVQYQF